MSNQGNIIFIPESSRNLPTLTFQTGRWSGSEIPRIVKESMRYSSLDRDFLHSILKDTSISTPIVLIGNEDVPTMVVDFIRRRIQIEYLTFQSDTPQRTLTFDEFLDPKVFPHFPEYER